MWLKLDIFQIMFRNYSCHEFDLKTFSNRIKRSQERSNDRPVSPLIFMGKFSEYFIKSSSWQKLMGDQHAKSFAKKLCNS